MQQKKSKIQKKRERRQRARQEKHKVQEEWSKRDTDTMLGTRQSYSQREKLCTLRPQTQPNQLDFDKENLLKEVQNMKEGDKVRFNLLILVTVKFLSSTINTHNTM